MDEFLVQFLQVIAQPLLWVLKQFFYWSCKILCSELAPDSYAALSNLVPDINAHMVNVDSVIAPYIGFVNLWIPLDIGYWCIVTYLSYIVHMITIKLIIKLFVPTLG